MFISCRNESCKGALHATVSAVSVAITQALILAAFAQTAALADNSMRNIYSTMTNPSNNVAKDTKVKGGRTTDQYYNHIKKAPRELPGMALPGDKQGRFQYGLERPDKNGTMLYLSYQMKGPKAAIIESYKESLRAGGWAIGPQVIGDQLSATLHGNAATVQVRNGGDPRFPTDMQIFYTIKNQ